MSSTEVPSRPRIAFDRNDKGPLAGIKVIDLSRVVAGNMTSVQLADFGADVIKVEPPGGDPLREWRERGASLFWKVYGRNKRSIVIDVRSPEGLALLRDLILSADVLIENFRPGTLEAMGLDPDKLRLEKPSLVVLRISGFGQTGPYASRPGFGTLIEAMSGLASRTGFADREPVLPPFALADMVAGLQGAMSVMIALYARDRNGCPGQTIDLSLLEGLFSILGPQAAEYELTARPRERVGSASASSAPRNIYRCRDGKYLALSGATQAMALRIFTVIGRPELATDIRFRDNQSRVRNREALDSAIGDWFATLDRSDAIATMETADVTVCPVYDSADAVRDAHFVDRILVDADDGELGTVPMHRITPRLSATPGTWRYQAPATGENSIEILEEIGLDREAISRLRSRKIIADDNKNSEER
jgi:crotonobetainyl-CoA:carnitine CoA-transferase CaiB-like acyl-CoA transferase